LCPPIFSVDPGGFEPTSDHSIEEKLLRDIRFGVMDERDLCCRHLPGRAWNDIFINVESLRVRRRKVAENELCGSVPSRWPPYTDYPSYGGSTLFDSGCASGSINRISSAAFRPRGIFSMLRWQDQRVESSISPRVRSETRMNALSSGLAGTASMAGLPF